MGADALNKPETAWIDAVRGQVNKILETSAFAGSRKLSDLLVFLVDQAIDGRSFNEYSIALDVFQKGESFDPRLDPVVRVYVRRLRDKLNQYRTSAGLQDPVEIVLPPRTYVPTIRIRPRPVRGGPPEPGSEERNIAVRAFRSLSPNKDDEYFCEGLVEEVIHALAKVKHLRVIPVSALEEGGVVGPSARELHDRFRVEAVLGGNVRKGPSALRVSAHLTNATEGTLIWSEIYEWPAGDVFTLETKTADAIVEAVVRKIQLLPAEELEPMRARGQGEKKHSARDLILLRSKAGEA
jgi:TolB-like protein